MFKPTRIITVLLLMVIFALPALAAEEEDRYQLMSKEANSSYYLDMKTLRHVVAEPGYDFKRMPELVYKDKGYVEAWVKVEYSKAGAKEVAESLVAQEKSVEGYDRLAFSLQLLRVKPASKEVALLEQADYDKNGKLLGRNVYPANRWVSFQAVGARAAEICDKLVLAQKSVYATSDR
jgi:hypothetical protein